MGEEIPPPKLDFSAPPPYEVATKLPSYEEVQREKTLQGEPHPQIHMVIYIDSNRERSAMFIRNVISDDRLRFILKYLAAGKY